MAESNILIEKQQKLHSTLLDILGSGNVYYQPPGSMKLKYPAIVYKRSDIDNTHADNNVYNQSHMYEITFIGYDPDDDVVEKLSLLPQCRFNRHFSNEGLNHDVFIINL